MIPATSNFTTKFTRPVGAVQLHFIITIGTYARAFTNQRNSSDGSGVTPSGYTGSTLYPWITNLGDIDITVNDLDGGADVTDFHFTVQDRGGAITGDFPTNVLEGQIVTVYMGSLGANFSDFIQVWTGFIDNVASVNSNLEYQFNCYDVSGYLEQVVYTVGDDGGSTSSDDRKTLNGHPLEILLDILQNQVGNQAVMPGSKAIPPAFIDTTTINDYINGPFNGVNFVFHLDQAVQAGEFIKAQLLKPLGGYLWVNSRGQLTVRFFYPLSGPTSVGSIDQNTWTEIPEADQTDMINVVQFSFDKDDDSATASGNYFSSDVEQYGPSLSKYGVVGEQVIQADGVRSAFQGFFIAAMTARLIFYRYGFKNLRFDQGAAESHLDTCLFEPGDIVSVTHPQVPDRSAGVMGITNKLFEILNKRWNLIEGLITYTMIDASYLSTFGFYEVAPVGEASYTSASSGDKSTYMFMCGTDGKYSNGDAGHVLG